MNRRHFLWILGIAIVVIVVVSICHRPLSPRVSMMNLNSATEESAGGAAFSVTDMAILSPEKSAQMFRAIDPMPPIYPGNPGSTGVVDSGVERLKIKTAELSVVTENVESQAQLIGRTAEEKGGFIVTSQVYDLNTIPRATVIVRVPAGDFDSVLGTIRGLGQVTGESINGQDVTAEYIDLDAQLKNLQAAEAQFLEIMKKATRIEDILAVQRELTQVRAQIESIEGRMKYLRESAEYSTITIYLSVDRGSLPVIDEGDEWKAVRVFKDALRSLADLGKAVLGTIIWAAVYLPVWLVLGLIVWLVAKKIKTKR